jgi:Ni/Fe-hydrogenase subunit HybB-like protein
LGLALLGGLAGAAVLLQRGLVVTGLSDEVPWGLWITVDLSSIAMSAGAFSLSAAVYLFGLRQFRPLARVAVFIGLIGYTMAVLTLQLDIGRPDRFWHALVFWNPHSVLWEVTMCVTLYLGVLSIEVAPLVGEAAWMQRRFPRLARRLHGLHAAAPALAVAGLCLSLLHQSSLGAAYGILKARPLWYKPDMSVLFMVSALAGGPALTLLACLAVSRLRRRAYFDRAVIDRLARIVGFILLGYLYLKFWDAFAITYTYAPGRTEGLRLLTGGLLQWNFWVGEVLLGCLVPVFILLSPRRRASDRQLVLAAGLVVLGVVLNRWDVNLSGLLLTVSYLPSRLVPAVAHYRPTWVEWATTAGVVAYGLLAFTLGVRYLPLFAEPGAEVERASAPLTAPAALPAAAGGH